MLHGQTRYNMASRFLDEIPQGLLKWLTPQLRNVSARSEATAGPARNVQTRGSTQRTTSDNGWHIGQNVMHDKFGRGIIINAEGSGTDARVQINFSHAGTKWLALSVAKLAPV